MPFRSGSVRPGPGGAEHLQVVRGQDFHPGRLCVLRQSAEAAAGAAREDEAEPQPAAAEGGRGAERCARTAHFRFGYFRFSLVFLIFPKFKAGAGKGRKVGCCTCRFGGVYVGKRESEKIHTKVLSGRFLRGPRLLLNCLVSPLLFSIFNSTTLKCLPTRKLAAIGVLYQGNDNLQKADRSEVCLLSSYRESATRYFSQ